jgi:hypothetical protein
VQNPIPAVRNAGFRLVSKDPCSGNDDEAHKDRK